MFKKQTKTNKQSGMTFIEIIVVLGIFATLSAVVLFNYRSFSDGVRLQNLSQEIALQGKRAQTLASQGRKPKLSDAQNTNGIANFLPTNWVSSYGLAFRPGQNPDSFIFYFNSPYYYQNSNPANVSERSPFFEDFVISGYSEPCGSEADSECIEEIQITDSSRIDLVCLNSEPVGNNADPDCTTGTTSSELHVSFTRPFLEAHITGEDVTTEVSTAFVRVTSPDGSQSRFVTFWSTGQITVN